MASGVPWRSTGIGVEPVVSTPMPTMSRGSNAGSAFRAAAIAPAIVTSAPLR